MAAKSGYTTQEWEVSFAGDGYENHLIAMKLWLQMELAEDTKSKFPSRIGSFIFFDDDLKNKAESNRLRWVAENLFQKNSKHKFS